MPANKLEKLSYPITTNVLPASGLKIELAASDDELQALAGAIDVLAVEKFRAELLFKRWRKDGVSLKARMSADVIQQCVITLEPVESHISETIEQTFLPEGSKLAKPNINMEGEMILDPEGHDIPDLFYGNTLDAWQIMLEYLQLALDPFPRKAGAKIDELAEEKDDQEQDISPFDALTALKLKIKD